MVNKVYVISFATMVVTLFLGRLPKVDLIILEGGKCPSVRPSTKSFFDFNEIWYIGRGR